MPKANYTDTFLDRVLVIDDQRSQLRLMKTFLTRYGCTVVTVDSAEEAEQMIQWGERFSLIITDIKMPWLNGLQFCKRLMERHPDISICALSGNLEQFDKKELENSGFDGIYQKPICDKTIRQILLDSRRT